MAGSTNALSAAFTSSWDMCPSASKALYALYSAPRSLCQRAVSPPRFDCHRCAASWASKDCKVGLSSVSVLFLGLHAIRLKLRFDQVAHFQQSYRSSALSDRRKYSVTEVSKALRICLFYGSVWSKSGARIKSLAWLGMPAFVNKATCSLFINIDSQSEI